MNSRQEDLFNWQRPVQSLPPISELDEQGHYVHHFNDSLARSKELSKTMPWRQVFGDYFPTMVSFTPHFDDGDPQRKGLDWSIVLASGKQVLVDEKVRGRNKKTGEVYEDIALEEWSNWGQQRKGWATKPMIADYVAYAIAPLGLCYMLPVPQTQAAWKRHELEWKAKYPCIKSFNPGYYSINWGIPQDVLQVAVQSEFWLVKFPRFELLE